MEGFEGFVVTMQKKKYFKKKGLMMTRLSKVVIDGRVKTRIKFKLLLKHECYRNELLVLGGGEGRGGEGNIVR